MPRPLFRLGVPRKQGEDRKKRSKERPKEGPKENQKEGQKEAQKTPRVIVEQPDGGQDSGSATYSLRVRRKCMSFSSIELA